MALPEEKTALHLQIISQVQGLCGSFCGSSVCRKRGQTGRRENRGGAGYYCGVRQEPAVTDRMMWPKSMFWTVAL